MQRTPVEDPAIPQGEIVVSLPDGSAAFVEWSANLCQGGRVTSHPKVAMCVGPGTVFSAYLGDVIYGSGADARKGQVWGAPLSNNDNTLQRVTIDTADCTPISFAQIEGSGSYAAVSHTTLSASFFMPPSYCPLAEREIIVAAVSASAKARSAA